MEGTAALSKSSQDHRPWRDFNQGAWCTSIDVRDFIVRNVTPYVGGEKFMAPASERTKVVWAKLQPYFKDEQKSKRGAYLRLMPRHRRPCWRTRPATSTATMK
jgi:formate C-acetyltransferase